MSKNVKVELHKTHRPVIEALAKHTGLSHNQIINHVWVRAAKIREELRVAHSTPKAT